MLSTTVEWKLSFIDFEQVDYFERAKRQEEISLLEKQYQEQREADRNFHKEQEEQKVRDQKGNVGAGVMLWCCCRFP